MIFRQEYKRKWGLAGAVGLMLVGLLTLAGCGRGEPSTRTPIHLNPNMDDQPKYKAQAVSQFFANGAAMQTPVAGTVARGELRDDDAYYRGMNAKGEFIKAMPVEITKELLERGEERFNIYCSPCHSKLGDGKGIMITKGYLPPPTFHDDRIRTMPDGQIFNTITNGIRNMPSYRHQIPVPDRWAIVAYLRALERSQAASIQDVPEELRDKVRQGNK